MEKQRVSFYESVFADMATVSLEELSNGCFAAVDSIGFYLADEDDEEPWRPFADALRELLSRNGFDGDSIKVYTPEMSYKGEPRATVDRFGRKL